MLSINLFGTPEIYLDEQPPLHFRTRKAQALLIYLAVTERSWNRDALATLFWPETDDITARKNLRDILPTLRKQLDDYLHIEDEIIGLNVRGPYQCDVTHFCAVLERPLQTISTDTLVATLALYRGEFLEGYASSKISSDFEMWVVRERERLQQLALMGFTTLCRRQQEIGDYAAALTTNRQLLKLAPWDEAAHRQQMVLLAQSGQQAAALAHFEACRQILAEELDVEPDAETVHTYEQIKAGQGFATHAASVRQHLPQMPPSDPIRHNLPRQLTGLIGREGDIDAVQHLLSSENTALLTLVGQGGVGKTRLALAVAQKLRQHGQAFFPDGIWFVSLAGIASGDNTPGHSAPDNNATEQIAGAIAQAMGLSLAGSNSLSKQIIRALEAQQLLLVLDNFEHLVAEQAFLLEVVQTAQQVKVMVTSREQLHLHAEHLYPVNGLPVPASADLGEETEEGQMLDSKEKLQTREDLGQYPSVQLFVTRVQQRLPEFALTAQNQRNIGRICRLLGGVPLGIELTAQLYVEQGAAVLAQLIAEIEQLDPLDTRAQSATIGLDHLQTSAIDLPERQRSIRAVFAHSWRLLMPEEQGLLRHCAIFRGGFTREAILTVAEGHGANLLSLVMKSLVRRDSHDRYDLHELIRQYVIDQFQQEPTVIHATAQKHARYFANFLAGQEERLFQEAAFHEAIRTEIYNIRAAWQWLSEQAALEQSPFDLSPSNKTNVTLLDSCVTSLFQFLQLAAQWQETVTLAQQAIVSLRRLPEQPQKAPPIKRLLGHLLAYAAYAGARIGEREAAMEWVYEAKQIGEALDDAVLMTQVYLTLAFIELGATAIAAQEMLEAAVAWASRSERPFLQVMALLDAVRHWSAVFSPELLPRALPDWEAAMHLIQTNRYHYLVGNALVVQGFIYQAKEEWDSAIQTMQQGLEACKNQNGSISAVRLAHYRLGYIHMYIGNFHEAQHWALLSYRQSKIQGNQHLALIDLYTLGVIYTYLGEWTAAERSLRELVTTAETLGIMVQSIVGYMGLGDLFNQQGAYTEAAIHYQKALQLVSTSNLPAHQALIQTGLAFAYLGQGRPNEAFGELESLLVADKLFTFNNRIGISIAAVAYPVLTALHDPQAAPILHRAYGLLQTELAKIKDTALRIAYLANIPENRDIVAFWEAKNM